MLIVTKKKSNQINLVVQTHYMIEDGWVLKKIVHFPSRGTLENVESRMKALFILGYRICYEQTISSALLILEFSTNISISCFP